MSKLSEKVAYLRGLAEGMNIDTKKNEGKLLNEVIEALELAAKQINYVEESVDDLANYIEDIDNDLAEVEDFIIDDGENEDEDGCCCGHKHDVYDFDEENDNEELIYECPHCGNEIVLDSAEIDMDSDPKCPECGKSIFADDEETEDVDSEDDED